MAIQDVNRSVKIIDNVYLRVTKNFAEKNLTKICLKYAEISNSKYYEWSFEDFAFCVIFEIPSCFDMDFETLAKKMGIFCLDYLKERNLNNWKNFKEVYISNTNKKINF